MANDTQDKFALSAPKGVLIAVLSIAIGGFGGFGGAKIVGAPQSRPDEAVAMPWLSKAEVVLAAREVAEKQAVSVREDCQRNLASAISAQTETINKMSGVLVKLGENVEQLRIDAAKRGGGR